MRLGRIVLAVGMVLLAACGGKAKSSDDTLPPEPKTTTTTAVSYDVPATIDQAYVQKVMQALDHVYGDAIRELAKARSVNDPEFLRRLAAVYIGAEREDIRNVWAKDVAQGLQGLKQTPGDPVTTVQSLVRADAGCVVAAVSKDFGPTRDTPVQPSPQQRYIALVPKAQSADAQLNPTPWALSFDSYIVGGGVPEKPCVA